MKLNAAYGSHVGHSRSSNQDSVGVFPSRGIFVLADGMGGLKQGSLVSQKAVQLCESELPPGEQFDADTIQEALKRVNRHIWEIGEFYGATRSRPAVGTTLVFLHCDVDCRQALWSHLGDSRLYRFRSGDLQLLTADHTDFGNRYQGGGVIPLDLPHTNLLGSAMGLTPEVEPLLQQDTIEVGDQFLLCSDGISAMLSPEVLRELLGREARLQSKVDELISAALSAGGKDNASVVLVECQS